MGALAAQAGSTTLPNMGCHDGEVRARLASLLAQLPEPYCQVLSMVELEGATLAEMTSFLGLSNASLRLMYIEGRRRLQNVVFAHTEARTL